MLHLEGTLITVKNNKLLVVYFLSQLLDSLVLQYSQKDMQNILFTHFPKITLWDQDNSTYAPETNFLNQGINHLLLDWWVSIMLRMASEGEICFILHSKSDQIQALFKKLSQ